VVLHTEVCTIQTRVKYYLCSTIMNQVTYLSNQLKLKLYIAQFIVYAIHKGVKQLTLFNEEKLAPSVHRSTIIHEFINFHYSTCGPKKYLSLITND